MYLINTQCCISSRHSLASHHAHRRASHQHAVLYIIKAQPCISSRHRRVSHQHAVLHITKAQPCISSRHRRVSHQHAVLYIIKAQPCISTGGINATYKKGSKTDAAMVCNNVVSGPSDCRFKPVYRQQLDTNGRLHTKDF